MMIKQQACQGGNQVKTRLKRRQISPGGRTPDKIVRGSTYEMEQPRTELWAGPVQRWKRSLTAFRNSSISNGFSMR